MEAYVAVWSSERLLLIRTPTSPARRSPRTWVLATHLQNPPGGHSWEDSQMCTGIIRPEIGTLYWSCSCHERPDRSAPLLEDEL